MSTTGTVKWFNGSKHYGFIAPDGGGRDVFVHRSALRHSGLAELQDGARVSFDLTQDAEHAFAANLVLLEAQADTKAPAETEAQAETGAHANV
ncbi:cold shock domain-containing protein [Actinocrinis puniceicyclus]|uniref:Cold shock domain-containing protein n=1 Tax=Actinocrinis puniceicyclus TaxID=977794 RepID=A0A8J7WTE8_9ACTN|nr:cold shock domain-containing protein [Actinocrinis puniceicyclus]